MESVLIVICVLSCLAMIVTILLQRSEGGALGIGGDGGGFMSGRGAASALSRATMILAVIFLGVALLMARLHNTARNTGDDVDRALENIEALQALPSDADTNSLVPLLEEGVVLDTPGAEISNPTKLAPDSDLKTLPEENFETVDGNEITTESANQAPNQP